MNRRRLRMAVSGALMLLSVGCKKDVETSVSPAEPQPTADPAAAATNLDPAVLLTRAQAIFKPLPEVMELSADPITPERVALGRQLYFEKRLSKNQDVSCNSCHDLTAYGVDSRGGKTSKGHKEQLGGRNSPTSYNAALHVAQFWDGRAVSIEEQAKGPVLNPVEMALPDAQTAVKVIKSIPGYKPLFKAAFPADKDPITFDNMAKAVGAFERKLVTKDRFDKFLQGNATALTEGELRGLSTFMDAGCVACHNGPGLGGAMYQKLGLMKPYETTDMGRFEVTKSDADKKVFKVPSLRNIEKTGPYFHDGSKATLAEAVATMGEYQTPKGKLSDDEIASVVTFLKALTGELPTEYIKTPAELAGTKTTPKPDPS